MVRNIHISLIHIRHLFPATTTHQRVAPQVHVWANGFPLSPLSSHHHPPPTWTYPGSRTPTSTNQHQCVRHPGVRTNPLSPIHAHHHYKQRVRRPRCPCELTTAHPYPPHLLPTTTTVYATPATRTNTHYHRHQFGTQTMCANTPPTFSITTTAAHQPTGGKSGGPEMIHSSPSIFGESSLYYYLTDYFYRTTTSLPPSLLTSPSLLKPLIVGCSLSTLAREQQTRCFACTSKFQVNLYYLLDNLRLQGQCS